jgi:single-strand DNA-binding protein
MFNKAQLIGRLGADPEVRTLNDGAKVTNLRVATTESWRDKDTSERKEKTEWHRVTVWGEGPANYLAYAEKGSLVLIEGKLTTRKWADSDGADRYSTEIMVQGRGGGQVKILADGVDRQTETPEPEAEPRTRARRGRKAAPAETFQADLDDEIPF